MAQENSSAGVKATLGLTGVTMNAMALIAPGAFLWITYQLQAAARKTQGSLDPGPVFRVRFDCAAGTNVSPTAFSCQQEQATDLSGSPFATELSNLIGCVVALSPAP